MTDREVNQLVTRVLSERFRALDFTEAHTSSEIDFDGTPILRVTAIFSNRSAPRAHLIAAQAISEALREQGEERFVFVSSRYHDDETEDEDAA